MLHKILRSRIILGLLVSCLSASLWSCNDSRVYLERGHSEQATPPAAIALTVTAPSQSPSAHFPIPIFVSDGSSGKSQSTVPAAAPEAKPAQSQNHSGKEQDEADTIAITRSLLGKDLIIGGYVANVDFENEIGNIPGLQMMWLSTRLVRLNLRGPEKSPTLVITRSPLRPWGGTENNHEAELAALPVKTATDTRILLDARAMGAEFSALFSKDGMSDRSTAGHTYAMSYFDGGLNFTVDQKVNAQVANANGQAQPISAAIALRFFIKSRTENAGFRPQTVSPEFGYFTLDDIVYRRADPVYKRQAIKRPDTRIFKWDVSKPITLTVSESVPDTYKPIVLSAIQEWNNALREELGLSFDFIRPEFAKVTPQDIGDPNKNILYWERDRSKGAGLMHAAFSADPITGEIFNGHIYSDGDFWLEQLGRIYDINVGRSGMTGILRRDSMPPPRAKSGTPEATTFWARHLRPAASGTLSTGLDLHALCDRDVADHSDLDLFNEGAPVSRDEFVQSYTREALMHEIGHLLGLRHNFMASLAYNPKKDPASRPTSIMDYMSNSAYLRGHVLGSPGAYDRQAIRYGYRFERAANPLPFCTDDETDYRTGSLSRSEFSPYCARGDEGAQPLTDHWIPRMRKLYIRMNLEKDTFERHALIEAFVSQYDMKSILFSGSTKASAVEKLEFARFTSELLRMESYKDGNGRVHAFADTPEFMEMRLGTAATFLLKTTMWPAKWAIDMGVTTTPEVFDGIRSILFGGEPGIPDAPLNERLNLLSQVIDVARRAVNATNRANALRALSQIRVQVKKELDLEQTSAERKETLLMIQRVLNDLKAETYLSA